MAFNPCRVGNHYNPRKNYLTYVSVLSGTEEERYRLRFCQAHSLAVQQQLSESEVNPEDGTVAGGDDALSNCLTCGQPIDKTGRQVFITSYPPNDERKDYWARVHVDCTLPEPLTDQWNAKSA